ncbi:MAG TPA: lysine biosynthesis protein LysX [Nitrososphaeria archaeon]|nr:lysine biosynthesis protein LysX [Nitrososphaeria archaeon]
MGAEVELLYDIPRLEEKLIMKALKKLGIELKLTNVKYSPLSWSDQVVSIALVRPISMIRAIYSASLREAVGAKTINNSISIMFAGDKVLTLSRFRQAGIPFPKSIIAFGSEAAEKAGRIIGYPAIDKPPIGSWGRLVTLVKDYQTLQSIVEHRELLLSQSAKTHIIQRYINEGDHDYRVLVLGGEPLGAIMRSAVKGDWRSNVARGGKVEAVKLDEELSELAVKAAEVIGGEFMAIDIFHDDEKYLVNEVNGVPEFKGFMEATKIDVAEKLGKYVKLVLKR